MSWKYNNYIEFNYQYNSDHVIRQTKYMLVSSNLVSEC